MRLVSPLLKRVIYPGLSRSGYLRRRPVGGPVTLTYHGILPPSYRSLDPVLDANLVSLSAFRQQLKFLKTCYHVIAPLEFRAWCEGEHKLPERSVLLTCDDGLKSCIDSMLPVLLEEKLSCLFFITDASLRCDPAVLWHELLYLSFATASLPFRVRIENPFFEFSVASSSKIGSAYWQTLLHLSQISDSDRESAIHNLWTQLKFDESAMVGHSSNRARFQVMNPGELLKLAEAGMELGGHTSSHLVLARMAAQAAAAEIEKNRGALARLTGQSVWSMAYPFGTPASAGPREYRMAREAGFCCAFTNCAGNSDSRFALPRVHITRDMDIAEFEAHVSGFHHAMQRFAAHRTGVACN